MAIFKILLFALFTLSCNITVKNINETFNSWAGPQFVTSRSYHTLIWPLFGSICLQQKIVKPVTFNYLFSNAYITMTEQLVSL